MLHEPANRHGEYTSHLWVSRPKNTYCDQRLLAFSNRRGEARRQSDSTNILKALRHRRRVAKFAQVHFPKRDHEGFRGTGKTSMKSRQFWHSSSAFACQTAGDTNAGNRGLSDEYFDATAAGVGIHSQKQMLTSTKPHESPQPIH